MPLAAHSHEMAPAWIPHALQSPSTPSPTIQPPCRFAQSPKRTGLQSNSRGRPRPTAFSTASSPAKSSAENSCGRSVISRWLVPMVTTSSSSTAKGRKTPAPARANQVTARTPTARINFKETRPALEPRLYAVAITTSASHSWLTQDLSLVNE